MKVFVFISLFLATFAYAEDLIPVQIDSNGVISVWVERTDACGTKTTTQCWFDTGSVGGLKVSWNEASSCSAYNRAREIAEGLGRDQFGMSWQAIKIGSINLQSHQGNAWKPLANNRCLIGLDTVARDIVTLDRHTWRLTAYNWPANYWHGHYIAARTTYIQLWEAFIGAFPGFSYSSHTRNQLMDLRRPKYWDYTYIPVSWVDACGNRRSDWCALDTAISTFAITHAQMQTCNQYPAPNINVVGQAIWFPEVTVGSTKVHNHTGYAYRSFPVCAVGAKLFWQRYLTIDSKNRYVATYDDPSSFWFSHYDAAAYGVCLLWSIFIGACPW